MSRFKSKPWHQPDFYENATPESLAGDPLRPLDRGNPAEKDHSEGRDVRQPTQPNQVDEGHTE